MGREAREIAQVSKAMLAPRLKRQQPKLAAAIEEDITSALGELAVAERVVAVLGRFKDTATLELLGNQFKQAHRELDMI